MFIDVNRPFHFLCSRLLRCIALLIAIALLAAVAASAQSLDDLKNDGKNPDNVLTYGMGYSLQRYSPLKQIDKANVKRLVPVWNLSLDNQWGEQAQPLVYNGVMYVTDAKATVAIDVATGKQIWKTPVDWPADMVRVVCCGVSNKGAAIFDGKVFRTTLDANVIALDMNTGKELWREKAAEWKDGYSMNAAPLIANGVLITGMSGAEYGTRGFLDGWDPQTGKHLWRRYTIPAPGEKGSDTWPKGDAYLHGGGSTWITGSYDPDLDLVYWGTGNAGPWNAQKRPGDNLYTCSLLALKPETGEVAWYYQFTPNDMYDYDAVWEPILADITVDGQPRKVVMQFNRNGFLYVLDRTNGKLLAANPYEKVNWASGIDLKTGRPIETDVSKRLLAGEQLEIWPATARRKELAPRGLQSPKLVCSMPTPCTWPASTNSPRSSPTSLARATCSSKTNMSRRKASLSRTWTPSIRSLRKMFGARPFSIIRSGPPCLLRVAACSSPEKKPASSSPSTPKPEKLSGSFRPAPASTPSPSLIRTTASSTSPFSPVSGVYI